MTNAQRFTRVTAIDPKPFGPKASEIAAPDPFGSVVPWFSATASRAGVPAPPLTAEKTSVPTCGRGTRCYNAGPNGAPTEERRC